LKLSVPYIIHNFIFYLNIDTFRKLPVIGEKEEDNRTDDIIENNDEKEKSKHETNSDSNKKSSKSKWQSNLKRCFCCGCRNGDTEKDLSENPSHISAQINGDNVTDAKPKGDKKKEKKKKELPNCLPKWMHIRFLFKFIT